MAVSRNRGPGGPATTARTTIATAGGLGLGLVLVVVVVIARVTIAPIDAAALSGGGGGGGLCWWRLVERAEWGARPPTSRANFTGPAPYVILHHSFNPGVCRSADACRGSMRSMQDFHMDGHGWPDIGYSFAVGGDGDVYVGRGFNVVGAHAPSYNDKSIGLLLIGNFMEQPPPAPMVQVAQSFLEYAVATGHLRPDYVLYGHRQVRDTDCPGDALFAQIQRWPHWRPEPGP